MKRERTRLENAIRDRHHDFTATYMALRDLHTVIGRHPDIVTSETISTLAGVLKNSAFSHQTQSFFLYREAAEILTSIVAYGTVYHLAERTTSTFKNLLGTITGIAKRASAEALGSLPLCIHSPDINQHGVENIPNVNWEDIFQKNGIEAYGVVSAFGRSLVIRVENGSGLLVLKLSPHESCIESIHREALWMEHLRSRRYSFPVRFNVPTPIRFSGGYVLRLKKTPAEMLARWDIDATPYAICFMAHEDYFSYPNRGGEEKRLDINCFREVMLRNAWLLGRLTALGIVHSAAIPLFHNRIQRHRRADRGLYEWQRGGRLDRWLESCRYPNFGLTGIRDFEHLVPFKNSSRKLYYQIGGHLLSLLLVTGSYFRNTDARRVGLGQQGNPVDARDLFDRPTLAGLVQDIFLNYYRGFVNDGLTGKIPIDFDNLAARMIEEMGVDRHMDEVIRVVDQREMTDKEFRAFLLRRHYSEQEALGFAKGVKDITVQTGPHLGGFNERISLPELIECLATMSALCIIGKHWSEKACQAPSPSTACYI